MRILAAGFALGVLWLQTRPELPAAGMWLALLATVAGLLAVLRIASLKPFGVFLLAIVAGFTWAAAMAHLRLADGLDPALEGRDVEVTGVIAAMPQPMERGARFDFDVEQAVDGIPRHIQLAWYNGMTPEEFYDQRPVRAGERWRFTVRLRLPHGSANPHGFDYEAWLLERGVRATGYVRPGPAGSRQRLDDFVTRPAYAVERLREALRERFRRALPDAPYAGVLVALAIGDQRAIPARDWEVFARTGVSHLMSISGLHVTMVSGLFAALLMALWRRVPPLALRLPAQKAAALAGALAALGYCLLSGYAVPAQRTLYMVAVVALALWLDRFSSATRVLALALLAVLLLDPWAVLSPGFWLSFGAVGLIFYVATGRMHHPRPGGWLAQWGAVQWAVTVGLAPLLLALFGQVSLASPLANAAAIPLVSFVVTPLALLGAVLPLAPLADALLGLAHAAFALLMPLLEWLASAEGAVWQQHAPAIYSVPLALLGALWLLAPRGVPSRSLGLVLMLPMFCLAPAGPQRGELWLTVLDVGQGLAVLARTQGHALLYDTGPAWNAQADSGSRIVLPYVRGEGVGRLDALVISHLDKDHSGGAAAVLAGLPVGQLATSMPAQRLPGFDSVPYRLPCTAGSGWRWDDVEFAWLHPSGEVSGRRGNDSSCVLRITAGGRSVLLPGDIEKTGEGQLLEAGVLQAVNVLLVPHHGSGTSSTPPFVAAVSPAHAVFTVGYRNRFGHPKREVWERYAAAERHRSDRDGAVMFRFGAAGIAAERQRETNRRYWQGR